MIIIEKFNSKLNNLFLYCLILLPAMFIFWAIQYSAITVPFWDHIELVKYISSYYDRSLNLSDLWQPHNHSRPLTYRLIFLINAILTDWDIRSEYIYIFLSIYGCFAVHIYNLWKLCGQKIDTIFLCFLSVVSIFFFSPVGHNNHWWSMMLQLNLANLFILFALSQISFWHNKWQGNLISCLNCWLATYTLTNGLIAFVISGFISQICNEKRFKLNKFSVFWIINIILCLILYIPGLPANNSNRPDVFSIVWFVLVYIGCPLGGMINFQYLENFYIPQETLMNGIIGLFLLIYSSFVLVKNRDLFKFSEPRILLLLSSFTFVIGSAFVTAWGRASFDSYGVANANASRYSIFSSLLIIGILYFCCASAKVNENYRFLPISRVFSINVEKYFGLFSMLLITTLAINTYHSSIKVYSAAHNFNSELSQAYAWSSKLNELDSKIYPVEESIMVKKVKSELKRLRIGPYKNPLIFKVSLSKKLVYKSPISLDKKTEISQEFVSDRNNLMGVETPIVTHSKQLKADIIEWKLYNEFNDKLEAKGFIDTKNLKDWQVISMNFGPLEDSKDKKYKLVLSSNNNLQDNESIGLPLYKSEEDINEWTNISITKNEHTINVEPKLYIKMTQSYLLTQ